MRRQVGCLARPQHSWAVILVQPQPRPCPLPPASLTRGPCLQVTGFTWAGLWGGPPGKLAGEPGRLPLPTGSPQMSSSCGWGGGWSGPWERPVVLWLRWAPSLPSLCKHAHTGTSRSPGRAGFHVLLRAPGAFLACTPSGRPLGDGARSLLPAFDPLPGDPPITFLDWARGSEPGAAVEPPAAPTPPCPGPSCRPGPHPG